MSNAALSQPVIAVEEHASTAALRDALLRLGDDVTVTRNTQGATDRRLLDVGDERLARMDAVGVDMQVLSIAAPGTHPLPAGEAIALARDANDVLAAGVDGHPDRFAAFATLPMADPHAAADELHRAVSKLNAVGALVFPRVGDRWLDHESFRPVFESAAQLRVPIYIHPTPTPRDIRTRLYGGFGDGTDAILATGGWGWHAETGLATLRLILAGTLDRHPELQFILGRWGEMLVSFADRAALLDAGGAHLERGILDYVTSNLNVTAGGVLSHRMMQQALAVLGPDRLMFGFDDPYGIRDDGTGADFRGPFGDTGGAQRFVETAPLSALDKAKLAHRNAMRILNLSPALTHSSRHT